MNLSHLHITLVHVPILFIPLGLVLLSFAKWKSIPILRATALGLFLFSTLLVIPAFLLGEEAEDAVKHKAEVQKHDIHEHEETADFALWLTIGLGVLSLTQIAMFKFKPEKSELLTIPILVLAVASSASLMKTAWEGGKIRHPEAYIAEIPE
jgi:hypothetical protein